jgi:hypothetical protein
LSITGSFNFNPGVVIVRTILPKRVMITVSYCGTTKSSVPHFNAVKMKIIPRIDMNGL